MITPPIEQAIGLIKQEEGNRKKPKIKHIENKGTINKLAIIPIIDILLK